MEEGAQAYPIAQAVLARFCDRKVILVRHYKDVFSRPGQDFLVQKESPKLILARRRDHFLYEGAPMCDRYGHPRFYYATMMMNCLYNCAYCYLQTLYPSANVVAFVNPEDYFPAIEAQLPAYVSISYDADVLALEHLFGYVKLWADFAHSHPDLTLEVRTKSANFNAIAQVSPVKNMILSWTVSPQHVIDAYEAGAPSLAARISSIKAAIEKGWPVRLCMDPVLPIPGWEVHMEEMLDQLATVIDPAHLYDISVGSFRMSEAQYKKLRRLRPEFPLLSFEAMEKDIAMAQDIIKGRFYNGH